MKIALITEGVGEYQALPLLYPQLQASTGNTILKPTRLPITPLASPQKIAKACKPQVLIAEKRGAQLIIVILDREQRDACPGVIATELASLIQPMCSGTVTVAVVLKNRTFENWLIADVEGLKQQPKRYKITKAFEKAVSPNKADHVDALALLERAALSPGYDKVPDGNRICQKLNLDRAAVNSRSFRHFLHVIGHVEFGKQCKQAIAT